MFDLAKEYEASVSHRVNNNNLPAEFMYGLEKRQYPRMDIDKEYMPEDLDWEGELGGSGSGNMFYEDPEEMGRQLYLKGKLYLKVM